MDENALIEEECIVDVAEENENFQRCVQESDSLKCFLSRLNVIYARSLTTESMEQEVFLQYSTDVDGCVVELKTWKGIKMPVRHLTIFRNDWHREIMPLLKKHINLTSYTTNQLSTFRHSVGFQLFYEQGLEGWIGIIPSPSRNRHALEAKVVAEIGKSYFQAIRGNFQKRLFAVRSQVLRTLTKNDMNDVTEFSVLPDDQDCILNTLQDAIDDCRLLEDFEIVQFCFRFGEKSQNGISLNAFHLTDIKRTTVHSAMDISSDDFELMWSMTGLQEIVGDRGVLSTCLSFRDCGNYQSNLNGKDMNISRDLKGICNPVGQLRFIQLYVDVPHRKPKSRFQPVSGCIAGGMVFHKETYAAFQRDANSYISTLESNFTLMETSSCRLEVVHETQKVKGVLLATDFINVDNVFRLLQKRPLIVPFVRGSMKCVREIGFFLTAELKELLEKYSATGNIEGIWKAYQLELAAEKMLWGSPFAHCSYLYSVNLGPGRLEPSRSLTDEKGFLALERWTACMATENSIPPCRIWTGSQAVESKIQRAAGFHDLLGSCPFVLGRRIIHTLIRDLYEAGKVYCRFEEFQRELYCETSNMFRVHGGVTIKRLSDLLSAKRRLGTHMVFGRHCEVLRCSKYDLSTVLIEGLKDLHMKHFPALKLYDTHGNQTLSWDSRCGLWKVCGNVWKSTEIRQCPSLLTTLVIADLETRGLSHASKLKSVPVSFPWIPSCARKLAGEKLNDDQLVSMLTFLSCIAFLMNGWYVEYNRLYEYMLGLPIKQYRMRHLEIQSALLLSNFNKFKLYRLHHSIPSRMTPPENQKSTSTSKEQPGMEPRQGPYEPVELDTGDRLITTAVVDDKNQKISARGATCVPLTKGNFKWSGAEIEVVHNVATNKRKLKDTEVYELYKEECMKEEIPFRGKNAFRSKLQRVMKDIGKENN